MRIWPKQAPIPTSHSVQDVLDQTEMIQQDICRKAMQACINYKAYHGKTASASKIKEAIYVYNSQPKADHQGSKIPFTEFRWIVTYIIEEVLPNKTYLVRKTGINKTQVLHRMRMRQFTPRQTQPDIRITPQVWKPDLEVSRKHDDLYARAWESEYEKPIVDAENNSATPPNSHEIPVQSDLLAEETRNSPESAHECSPETSPQTEQVCDVTDTYPTWNLMWRQARNS